MSEKLFSIRFDIRERDLHELLLALPQYKIGTPEIHAVPAPLLALPAPKNVVRKGKKQNVVGPKVRAAMALKQEWRITELANEIGENKQSVNSALGRMVMLGFAKKVRVGVYMRTKLDPIPAGNGAAE